MKDFAGNELIAGMTVVYLRNGKNCGKLRSGVIDHLTLKMLYLTNGDKTYPYQVVVPMTPEE